MFKMKKNYFTPLTEVIDIAVESEVLAGTVTPSTGGEEPFDGGGMDVGGGWADDDE